MPLPLFTSDVKQEVAIRKGDGDFYNIPSKTVMECFDETVAKHGSKPALHQKIPKKGRPLRDSHFITWTWSQYRNKVDQFAKSLISIGFQQHDVINIIGFNSREWCVANFGAIAAGGVAAGIYATNHPQACKYVTEHSESKVVVCEGIQQLEKYYSLADDLPNLLAIVMYGPDEIPSNIETKIHSVPVYKFDDFLTMGKDIIDSEVKSRIALQKPGHTCTLIYTSGTTGPPKAVMLTHDNITWTVRAMIATAMGGQLDDKDHIVSFLPLSHVAAQMLDMHMPMQTGAQCHFAMPDALKGTLGVTLREVRPTLFFGVPRVWEKMYETFQEAANATTGAKKMLWTWIKSSAGKHWESKEFGSKASNAALAYPLVKPLVHKVHALLGFDRCRAFFVSSAPIDAKILKYFMSLDIPIMELFGQSECSGPHACNTLGAFKLGTVGRPMPGTETMIDGGNNELCYRGRHVFAGYMKMEDDTKKTIDAEGWLHSGDVVKIDNYHDPRIPKPSGFITIVGRIKELIITAGGENIPPLLIENQFKHAMPALSNCMVVGDRRKFLTIVLCLKVEIDEEGMATTKLTGRAAEISRSIGSTATTTDKAKTCHKWKTYLNARMSQANHKAVSHAQQIVRWTILPSDFTIKGGELTPTLKLKRSAVAAKYKNAIDAMYAKAVK